MSFVLPRLVVSLSLRLATRSTRSEPIVPFPSDALASTVLGAGLPYGRLRRSFCRASWARSRGRALWRVLVGAFVGVSSARRSGPCAADRLRARRFVQVVRVVQAARPSYRAAGLQSLSTERPALSSSRSKCDGRSSVTAALRPRRIRKGPRKTRRPRARGTELAVQSSRYRTGTGARPDGRARGSSGRPSARGERRRAHRASDHPGARANGVRGRPSVLASRVTGAEWRGKPS